jgi:hypothetical protein
MEIDMYKCNVCGEKFEKHQQRTNHIVWTHKKKKKEYKCIECNSGISKSCKTGRCVNCSKKYRKPVSEETKKKISKSQKGKKLTTKHIANIKKAAKNRPPVSEETRKKLSKVLMGKNKGNKCWRRGLTKETDVRVAESAKALSETRKKKFANGELDLSGSNNPMFGKPCPHSKWTEYNGKKFRSTWEALVAEELDKQNIEWKYENIRVKVLPDRSYCPDFCIIKYGKITDVIEVKGYKGESMKLFYAFKECVNIPVHLIDDVKNLAPLIEKMFLGNK